MRDFERLEGKNHCQRNEWLEFVAKTV